MTSANQSTDLYKCILRVRPAQLRLQHGLAAWPPVTAHWASLRLLLLHFFSRHAGNVIVPLFERLNPSWTGSELSARQGLLVL